MLLNDWSINVLEEFETETTEFMRQRERYHLLNVKPYLLANKNIPFLTDEEKLQRSREKSLEYYYTHKSHLHSRRRGRPRKNERQLN